MGIRLVALAALLTLLGGLGWDLSRDLDGLKTVGAVRSLEGGGEGDTLVAPKGLVGAREDGSGKGTAPDVSASASGSASAPPASVSASASAAPERQASEPPAPEPGVEEPSTTSQVPEGSSGSGGQAAGTLNPGAGGESAAQEQYQ